MYLANQRVIPLKGISSNLMFYLAIDIEEIPGVHSIQTHKLTVRELDLAMCFPIFEW